MNLTHGWTIHSDNFELRIFSSISNNNDFVIRDDEELGALLNLSINNTDSVLSDVSWDLRINMDYENKHISLSSMEKKRQLEARVGVYFKWCNIIPYNRCMVAPKY